MKNKGERGKAIGIERIEETQAQSTHVGKKMRTWLLGAEPEELEAWNEGIQGTGGGSSTVFRVELKPYYWKWGSWTSSICITWELFLDPET